MDLASVLKVMGKWEDLLNEVLDHLQLPEVTEKQVADFNSALPGIKQAVVDGDRETALRQLLGLGLTVERLRELKNLPTA